MAAVEIFVLLLLIMPYAIFALQAGEIDCPPGRMKAVSSLSVNWLASGKSGFRA
jgi:hypothetical protein